MGMDWYHLDLQHHLQVRHPQVHHLLLTQRQGMGQPSSDRAFNMCSTVEDKETSLVWCYEDADPDFGSCQAKELLDFLESVLANEPVSVKSDLNNVEVKPLGVSKGLVAELLLSIMRERRLLPDFVLCIRDDRSDEGTFKVISTAVVGPSYAATAEVFACMVGRKPSKAKYYLDDTTEIVRLMQGLESVSEQAPKGFTLANKMTR